MNTDERFHGYCRNVDTVNSAVRLEDKQRLMRKPESSQLIMDDDYYANTCYYIQNELNDEIKHNSINLSTSYWDSVFESIKLVNRYWAKIFDIGIDNSSVMFQKDRTIPEITYRNLLLNRSNQ
jgi:hypothetical protein